MDHPLDKTVRHELVALLEGGNAHMSFDDVVADFPLSHINHKKKNLPYSPWHFLEHMRIAQWDILEFVRNPTHQSPDYPAGYRPNPVEQTDDAGWFKTIKLFRSDLQEMVAFVLDVTVDLFAPLPHAPAYTMYREILLLADHNSYHIGEFAVLRQLLGLWPSHLSYLTGSAD